MTYDFNFGDNRGQNWEHSNQSKNTQTGGPLAAHVFDLPGTYTVRVRARGSDGLYSDATVTVTVQNPDTVYAGVQTVCVSMSGNFTGCPLGALQQATLPSSFNGKRILLKRGDTFGMVQPSTTDSSFQIGAYGTGAKPTVTGFYSGMVGGSAAWANDFTVMELNIAGSSVGASNVNIEATGSRILLYRNDIKTPGQGAAMVNIGTAADYYHTNGSGPVTGAIYFPREIFIVENDIQGIVSAMPTPNLVVMGSFQRSAIMGNTIDRASQHSLRIWAANKLVISHNLIGGNHHTDLGSVGIRGAVKIHSAGTTPMGSTIAAGRLPATSQVIMANNTIGSSTYPGSFLSGFSPQNADLTTVEGLEDCIAESNRYVRGPSSVSELQLRGRRLTARGNTMEGGGTPNIVRAGYTYATGLLSWDGPYFISN